MRKIRFTEERIVKIFRLHVNGLTTDAIRGGAAMSFTGKFTPSPPKRIQRIRCMTRFQRPSSKRKTSRNLVKRYFRLIR